MFLSKNLIAGLMTLNDLPLSSHIEILDIQGNTIRQFETCTPSYTLDVENWKSGWYTIKAAILNEITMYKLCI